MQRLLLPFVFACCSTAGLLAQNCPSGNLGLGLGVGDDVTFAIQPIGFAFPFGVATYTDVHIGSNGYFFLSNGGVPAPGVADYTATTAEFVAGSPRVAVLWTDLDIRADNSGQVHISSSAMQCTITWRNAQNYTAATGGGALFDLQAQLFPSGEVRCFYGANAANNSSIVVGQPGIVGATPGVGAVLPTGSDLSMGGVTLDDTVFELWTAPATFDMAGLDLFLVATFPGWAFATATPANCAARTNYGTGCLDATGTPNSYYEFMTPAGFDLSGMTITMLRAGDGYIVLNTVPGAIVTPSGSATIIADADDTQQTVGLSTPMPAPGGVTSSLTVCSNAFISLGALGNGTAFTPVVATFLGWAQTAVAAWHDYNPTIAGSGKILFEEVAGIAYVTWDNVYSFATTTPSQLQFQFNVTTGDITLVFGTVSAVGNSHLVGYSFAGPSADPGPTDLSSMFGTLQVFDDKKALALTTNSLPVLGNLTFAFVTTNVPNLIPLAFVFVGDTQVNPGLDLTFLGMPGCFGYTTANLTSAAFPVNAVAGSGSQVLPIPNNAMFVGASLAVQAVAFSLDTPLNLIASNGTQITIGY